MQLHFVDFSPLGRHAYILACDRNCGGGGGEIILGNIFLIVVKINKIKIINGGYIISVLMEKNERMMVKEYGP